MDGSNGLKIAAGERLYSMEITEHSCERKWLDVEYFRTKCCCCNRSEASSCLLIDCTLFLHLHLDRLLKVGTLLISEVVNRYLVVGSTKIVKSFKDKKMLDSRKIAAAYKCSFGSVLSKIFRRHWDRSKIR